MFERAHLNRPVGWLGLLGLVLVPVIIAASFTWATWKSDTRLQRIDAAIVNLDEPVTLNDQLVPMGRQLAAGLVTGDPDNPDLNINWVLSDPADAEAGMASGRYAAVVTIPKNFSKAATSFGGPAADAEKAVLQIETSQIGGVTDPQVAQLIVNAASQTMSTTLTETYLDNIYLGFNQMGEQFGELADGTSQLADGAGQLADGVDQAAEGTDELAGGMDQLRDGGGELSAGGHEMASGSGQLADGLGQMRDQTRGLPGQAQQLADGAGQLADGADALSSGASQLSTGVQQYGAGVKQFAGGVQEYTDGVAQYAGGVKQLVAGAQPLVVPLNELADALEGTEMPSEEEVAALMQQLAQLPGALRQVGGGFNQLTTQLEGLATNGAPAPEVPCPAELSEVPGGCDAFQAGFAAGWQNGTQAVGQALWEGYSTPDPDTGLSLADAGPTLISTADQVETGLGSLESLTGLLGSLDGLGDGSTTPSDGIRQFTAGLTQLDEASDQIISGGTALSTGAQQIAAGADGLTSGAAEYAGGVSQYATGAQQLADGAGQLPAGMQQLADGIAQSAAGAGQLAGGVSQYAAGVDQYTDGVAAAADGTRALAEGITQLGDGASQLADGTNELAAGIEAGRDELPHYSATDRQNLKAVVAAPVTTNLGTDAELLPVVSTTALLMAMALWIGALATYLLIQAVSARTLTSSKPSWQLAWRSIWPGVAIAAVQAVALTAVGQMVVGLSIGRLFGVLAILLLAGTTFVVLNHALVAWLGGVGRVISVTLVVLSVSGAITSALPEFFLAVRPFLPLTPALDALRAMMVGGSGVGANVGALLGWLVIAGSASVLAVVRSRTVTAARLVTRFA